MYELFIFATVSFSFLGMYAKSVAGIASKLQLSRWVSRTLNRVSAPVQAYIHAVA